MVVAFVLVDEGMSSTLLLLQPISSATTTVSVLTVTGKAKDGTATVAITHDLAVIPSILLIIAPIWTVFEGNESQGVLTHYRTHPSAGVGYRGVGCRFAVAVLLANADDAKENVLIGRSGGGGGGVG